MRAYRFAAAVVAGVHRRLAVDDGEADAGRVQRLAHVGRERLDLTERQSAERHCHDNPARLRVKHVHNRWCCDWTSNLTENERGAVRGDCLLVHVFVGDVFALDEPRAEREAGCVREEDDALREAERRPRHVRTLHILTAKRYEKRLLITQQYYEKI